MRVTIITGFPKSGKTTIATALDPQPGVPINKRVGWSYDQYSFDQCILAIKQGRDTRERPVIECPSFVPDLSQWKDSGIEFIHISVSKVIP